MKTENNTIEMLTKFVNQRPGLDFANYGDSKSYNAESREITKDRNDYFELLSLAFIRLGDTFEGKLKYNLEKTSCVLLPFLFRARLYILGLARLVAPRLCSH